MTHARRQRRGGYTLIEVMVAVAIMTVGSLGVLALHEATTVGNITARNTAMATAITRTWIERIEREAFFWDTQGQPPAAAANLTTVPLAAATPGVWTTPTGTLASERAAFDYMGRDVVPANGRFCTHVRFRWVVPGQAIRADVRTHFARNTATADWANFGCGVAVATITAELGETAAPPTGASRISAVYGSTVVRRR